MSSAPSVIARNHVVEWSGDGPPLLFSHGYGCDQRMWRFVAPSFQHTHRVITFDHVGFGRSDVRAWDPVRHASLDGYAADVLEILAALGLRDVVFVGHSVGAMIGLLAAVQDPSLFAHLVLLCPSPRFIDEPDTGYVGGFSAEAIHGLIEELHRNQQRWADGIVPVIMGNSDRPELGAELHASFCRVIPVIAQTFARATFESDHRAALKQVQTPTAIIHTDPDVIAPLSVGAYMHAQIAGSTLTTLPAEGHCPNLSAPYPTVDAIAAAIGP